MPGGSGASGRVDGGAQGPTTLDLDVVRTVLDTKVIVNACCPGYVATDFTGFAAPRTPEQGAAVAIRLVTLPDDGPRGGFFDDGGVVPW
ncbi:hypothetical protein GCM10009634_47000 [Saccharothrix xinjiangensis]